MSVPTQRIVKWVLLVGCLSGIGWLANHRATSGYTIWMTNQVERGRLGILQTSLSPEAAAKKFGWKGGQASEGIVKLDGDLRSIAVSSVERLEGFPSSHLDVFGSPYFGVFDFNNDGLIPNPESLTTPPNPGAVPTLKQRLAIFSAGPDGDPTTWEDNVPPSFE